MMKRTRHCQQLHYISPFAGAPKENEGAAPVAAGDGDEPNLNIFDYKISNFTKDVKSDDSLGEGIPSVTERQRRTTVGQAGARRQLNECQTGWLV